MKKWYLQTYINKSAWVIENLANLNLTSDEVVVIMVIIHLNDNNFDLSMDLITLRSGLKKDVVDKVLSILCAKQYLQIQASGSNLQFKLDNLFESEVAKVESAMNQNLFEVFEDEFGRPLGRKEMEQIVDWSSIYENKLILYALKESSLYNNVNINYINKVLQNWKTRNINVEMIESGEHLGNKQNT